MKSLSRGWSVVLVASLSLNLFVLGFVATVGVRAAQAPAALLSETKPAPAQPAAPAAQRIVAINAKALRPSQQAVRKANEAVNAALLAEPYDPARLALALEELRAATGQSQEAVHEQLLTAVNGMSAEQRARFAEASVKSRAERVLLTGR